MKSKRVFKIANLFSGWKWETILDATNGVSDFI